MLTSSQSLSVLEEKAQKKRAEAEAKAKHKQAMEEKKMQRVILRKRKEEEKAVKAEERQKQQAAMAAKHSKQTTGQKGIAKKAHIDVNTSTGGCSEAVVKQSSTRQLKTSGSKDAPKTSSTSCSNEEEINTDQCAICFRTYNDDIWDGTGEDWIECVCGRRVHENCVEYDIVADATSRERMCPHCVCRAYQKCSLSFYAVTNL